MNKIKILLVDDHESFRCVLASFLRAQPGVELVGEAVDGDDAIDQSNRFQPDLVLMDVHMPKRSGIEASRTIKGLNPKIMVVMMSMDSSECYEQHAQRMADGYLPKSTMKSSLLSLLAKKQSHREMHEVGVVTA